MHSRDLGWLRKRMHVAGTNVHTRHAKDVPAGKVLGGDEDREMAKPPRGRQGMLWKHWLRPWQYARCATLINRCIMSPWYCSTRQSTQSSPHQNGAE